MVYLLNQHSCIEHLLIYLNTYHDVGLIANTKAKKKTFYKRRNILVELDIINSKPMEMCPLCIYIDRNIVVLADTKAKEDIYMETFGFGDEYNNYDIIDALQKIIIQYYLTLQKGKQ